MATTTIPALTERQRVVLAEMPEVKGNGRAYKKLADLGLVFRVGEEYTRKEAGDEVLVMLRAEGAVPEAEDNEGREDVVAAVEQPESEQPEQPKVERTTRGGNPVYPAPNAVRRCLYPGHVGERDLPFEDDTNFPLRKSGERVGSAVGWCHGCQKLHGQSYRKAKAEGTVTPRPRRSSRANVAASFWAGMPVPQTLVQVEGDGGLGAWVEASDAVLMTV